MGTRAGSNPETAPIWKLTLDEKVPRLGAIKLQRKSYEDEEKPLVASVKSIMLENDLKSFETAGGWKATLTTSTKETMDEEEAIQILKEELASEPALLETVIKTREYIDQDALERAVYSKQIDGAMLATAIKEGQPTHTLKVTKAK